jgi:ribosome maturation factor RimP
MLRSPRTPDPTITRVHELARPIAASHGVELVDVAWSSDRGARVLRVVLEVAGLAERQLEAQLAALESAEALEQLPDPAGGVSLEDCARFSRELSEALDADESAVPGAYTLEVSSPGLERALLSVADFVRFRGLVARVKLAQPAADGQKLLRGTLEGFEGLDLAALRAGDEGALEGATLRMRVDGKLLKVALGGVVDASLVYVFADEVDKPRAKRAPERARPGRAPSARKQAREPGSNEPRRPAIQGDANAKKRPERASAHSEGARTSGTSRTRSRT